MAINTVLAATSGVLGFVQALPYLRSMLQGRTKPSRVACTIGVVCNVCLVTSLIISGNTSGLVLPMVFLLTGTATLALSFKYGIGGITRTDIIAGAVAALAIIAWFVMGTNGAVIGANTAQATALAATFIKLRKNPGTEDLVSWSIGGAASLVALIAVLASGSLTVATLVLPIRCLSGVLLILGLAYLQHRAARNAATPTAAAHHFHTFHNPFARAHFGLAA